jgi:hypothetical protein
MLIFQMNYNNFVLREVVPVWVRAMLFLTHWRNYREFLIGLLQLLSTLKSSATRRGIGQATISMKRTQNSKFWVCRKLSLSWRKTSSLWEISMWKHHSPPSIRRLKEKVNPQVIQRMKIREKERIRTWAPALLQSLPKRRHLSTSKILIWKENS